MKDFDYYDVDYCKYGIEYRKRTRLWTNLKSWKPRPLCKKDCNGVIGNRHKETAQRLPCNTKVDGRNKGRRRRMNSTEYPENLFTICSKCLHVQPINTPLEYCRHVTHDVFWLKVKRRSETSKPRFHGSERVR